jgi:hypothetical protein
MSSRSEAKAHNAELATGSEIRVPQLYVCSVDAPANWDDSPTGAKKPHARRQPQCGPAFRGPLLRSLALNGPGEVLMSGLLSSLLQTRIAHGELFSF